MSVRICAACGKEQESTGEERVDDEGSLVSDCCGAYLSNDQSSKLDDLIHEAIEAAQISDNLLFLADEAHAKHRESLKKVDDSLVAAWEAWKAAHPGECHVPSECLDAFFAIMKEKGWIGIQRYPSGVESE